MCPGGQRGDLKGKVNVSVGLRVTHLGQKELFSRQLPLNCFWGFFKEGTNFGTIGPIGMYLKWF